jgi:hypothetical protein
MVILRLIYPPSVSQRVKAANFGLEPFTRLGVLTESECATDKAAFDGIRYPALLREAAFASTGISISPVLKTQLNDRYNTFGIVMTPYGMVRSDSNDPVFSIGGYMKCAVVSLSEMLRLPEQLRDILIAAAVRYEAAHVLIPGSSGVNPNCQNKCLMQGFIDSSHFVDRIISQGMDLCSACSSMISGNAKRLAHSDKHP